MKGLLYKEAVAMWRNKQYLLMLLIFSAVPTLSYMGYGVAFTALLPMTLIQIDEQARWGRLSVMLPYSNLQLVLPKYLCAWAWLLFTSAISAISCAIQSAHAGEAAGNVLFQALLSLACGALLCALVTPLLFRFGTQRGRIAMIAIVALCVAVAVGLAGLNLQLPIPSWLPAALLALALLVSALSIHLSQRWYRKGVRV